MEARRAAQSRRRRRATLVKWADDEWAAVAMAAGRVGITPTTFVAAAALAAADGVEGPRVDHSREAVAQLVAARTQLVKVGTNLNQAVHRFHLDGDAPGWLGEVVEQVASAVARVDEVTAEVGGVVRRRTSAAARRRQRSSERSEAWS